MSTDKPLSSGHAHARKPGLTPLQVAYQAEASGDLVAMSFPGVRRIAGWLFWVVFPLLCVAALALAVRGFVEHVGNQPDGTRGTYIAERSCSRGICLVGGTFVSDDGRLKATSLLGDPRWADGSEHRVIYDGKSAEVIGLGAWDATPAVMAGVGALTYLSVVGYFARAVRRDRRLMKSAVQDGRQR
jgi:hypothetical protein